jgi:hypothetical protein
MLDNLLVVAPCVEQRVCQEGHVAPSTLVINPLGETDDQPVAPGQHVKADARRSE